MYIVPGPVSLFL